MFSWHSACENLTRSQIQLLNRSGGIRIEGRPDKAGYRIRGGETIEVDLHVAAAGTSDSLSKFRSKSTSRIRTWPSLKSLQD